MNTWLSSIDSRCSYSVSQLWAFMFVVHTSNCHGQNCTRRAIFRLGIDTLIANILVIVRPMSHPRFCRATLSRDQIKTKLGLMLQPRKGPVFSQHWCIVAYVHSTLTSHHRQKGLACNYKNKNWLHFLFNVQELIKRWDSKRQLFTTIWHVRTSKY